MRAGVGKQAGAPASADRRTFRVEPGVPPGPAASPGRPLTSLTDIAMPCAADPSPNFSPSSEQVWHFCYSLSLGAAA